MTVLAFPPSSLLVFYSPGPVITGARTGVMFAQLNHLLAVPIDFFRVRSSRCPGYCYSDNCTVRFCGFSATSCSAEGENFLMSCLFL